MTTDVTWARLRKFVKNRDKGICQYCGIFADDGHCDHKIPISKGGTDDINNLVWSCITCNLTKGSKIIQTPETSISYDFISWIKTKLKERRDKKILEGIERLCNNLPKSNSYEENGIHYLDTSNWDEKPDVVLETGNPIIEIHLEESKDIVRRMKEYEKRFQKKGRRVLHK